MARALPTSSRWLVVGTGRHVERYGLPALVRAHGAEVGGVCGSDPGRAAEIAARYGVARWETSLPELLADSTITHVYVSSRNHDHEAQVLLAATQGKHILCEKPLAEDSTSARRMVEACAANGVLLGTGFHLRHNEAHRRARQLLSAGAIGPLLRIEIAYSHAVSGDDSTSRLAVSRSVDSPSRGIMTGTGAHAVDLAQWLAGSPITGLTAALTERESTSAGPLRLVQISGRTQSDILVDVIAGRLLRPDNHVAVIGTDGRLTVDASVGNDGGGQLGLYTAAGEETIDVPDHDVYTAQFESFMAASRHEHPPDASGADGLAALLLAEAVERALRTPFAHTHVKSADHSGGEVL